MANQHELNQSDRDDIRAHHVLVYEGFFNSTPWETFIELCLTFIEKAVNPLTHDPLHP